MNNNDGIYYNISDYNQKNCREIQQWFFKHNIFWLHETTFMNFSYITLYISSKEKSLCTDTKNELKDYNLKCKSITFNQAKKLIDNPLKYKIRKLKKLIRK